MLLVAISLAIPTSLPPPIPDALLIVVGTALLIRTGTSVMSAFGVLSLHPLVFVGLIS